MEQTLKNTLWILILIAVGSIALGAYGYWQYFRYPVTHNASVKANLVEISSVIGGKVTAVYVKNHSYVKRGARLFDLDPKALQLAVATAKSNLNQIRQEIQMAENVINETENLINERQETLSEISKNIFMNQAHSDELKLAAASLEEAFQGLNAAYQQFGKRGEATAKIKAAEKALQDAQLNLAYTHIVAPTNGYIDKLTITPDSTIIPQQKLITLVENNEWWVAAPFNTYTLKRIKLNQPVAIKLNGSPNYNFQGLVESIRPDGVIIKILNPGAPLSIGQKTTVKIDTAV